MIFELIEKEILNKIKTSSPYKRQIFIEFSDESLKNALQEDFLKFKLKSTFSTFNNPKNEIKTKELIKYSSLCYIKNRLDYLQSEKIKISVEKQTLALSKDVILESINKGPYLVSFLLTFIRKREKNPGLVVNLQFKKDTIHTNLDNLLRPQANLFNIHYQDKYDRVLIELIDIHYRLKHPDLDSISPLAHFTFKNKRFSLYLGSVSKNLSINKSLIKFKAILGGEV